MKHIDDEKELYAPEVNEHSLRWTTPNDINDWQEAVKGLYSFASIRPTVMREQLRTFLVSHSLFIQMDCFVKH